MAISDFVLLHNKAAEGLAKHDRIGYDLYSGIADTKALFIKYCKPFEKRIRLMVPTHRVVPAGDGEDSTSVSVPGFLVDPKPSKTKKTFAPIKVEMQFLENHKNLYLELHGDLSKIAYAPQSEAALTNFQTLLIMEIGLLMGCDVDWGTANPASAATAANAGAAILPPAAGDNDGDASDSSGGADSRRAGPAGPGPDTARGGADGGGTAAAVDPADAEAAAAYAAAVDSGRDS
jgi:hypothetical protein